MGVRPNQYYERLKVEPLRFTDSFVSDNPKPFPWVAGAIMLGIVIYTALKITELFTATNHLCPPL